ncbi:MAG: hypothetical protein JST30_05180 [Armatimonadetes bacterium]|nr:hypothetical protein [Armatimonadota bacterium]
MTRFVLGSALLTTVWPAAAQDLRFEIDPAKTWTDGTTRVQFWSRGSFQGLFDAVKRPFGTQTKVGDDGWGVSENDPVPAAPYLELGHAALVRTAGTFRLVVDTTRLTATLSDYRADRIPDRQGIRLSATVALNNAAFKTIKPTGDFADHLRPLNLGLVTVDTFTIAQKTGSRTSTMVPLGGGDYLVAVTFMATARLGVKEFGQTLPFTFDVPCSLVGKLHIGPRSATFGHPRGQGGENVTRDVDIPVRSLPFFVLNGQRLPASLLLDARVGKIGISVNGVRSFQANAVLP